MKICILSDAYEESTSPLKAHDLPCDPTRYLDGHACDRVSLNKSTAVRRLIELSKRGYDVFINLCDGAWDEDRPGVEVVEALERLGQAYTGATPAFFEPSREAMKRVCHYWGIGTPAYAFAGTERDLDWAAAHLRFPMIVKHPSSYSSIGLTRASRVTSPEALRDEGRKMIDAFGRALVEEFIDGREFTVLVAENPDDPARPTTYCPIEYRFPEGETFKHFDMKWVTFHDMYAVPVDDPDLSARLQDVSARLFVGLDGAGYGRCDLRMNAAGELFMLEINPNCGIFYPPEDPGSADAILQHDPAGHRGFLDQILRAALRRQAARRRPWEVRATRTGGYGMYATAALAPGDLIEAYEERPHVLVTKTRVEQRWDARKRAWFDRFAYPLTDEVWVMWDPDPDAWKPINHACDPNAWLDGLDLVARRAIAPGDEITMDYATFCGEAMEAFACACGAPGCRGIVRGTDHLEPFVERYGDHVADYVRTRRRAARHNGQPTPSGPAP